MVSASRQSAGIVLHRRSRRGREVLLVHPGGPFWARKDAGAWSIPKGEIEPGGDALATAKREFREETGSEVTGECTPLPAIRQKGGKLVHAWAVEGDLDVACVVSNTFVLEWPPRSGSMREFPEVDRAEWFTLRDARTRILASQVPFLDALAALVGDVDAP